MPSNILIHADTSGTLSTIDDNAPMMVVISTGSWILVFMPCASSDRIPTCDSADTAIRMPRKNRIVGMSMVCSADDTRPPSLESILKCFTQNSVTPQITPSDNMMPMNGGRPVTVLKIGTNSKPETPMMSIALLK